MPCLKENKADPKGTKWRDHQILEVSMLWSHSYPQDICWLQLPKSLYLTGMKKNQETKSLGPTKGQGLALNLFTKSELSKAYSSEKGKKIHLISKENDKVHFCLALDSQWKEEKMLWIIHHYTRAPMLARNCRIRPVPQKL